MRLIPLHINSLRDAIAMPLERDGVLTLEPFCIRLRFLRDASVVGLTRRCYSPVPLGERVAKLVPIPVQDERLKIWRGARGWTNRHGMLISPLRTLLEPVNRLRLAGPADSSPL